MCGEVVGWGVDEMVNFECFNDGSVPVVALLMILSGGSVYWWEWRPLEGGQVRG